MYKHEPGKIIGEVVEAHGGEELWEGLKAIDATISARGFLFTAKRRPVLDRVLVRAEAHRPHFTFYDFPEVGQKSKLIGTDEVRIVSNDDIFVQSRKDPRSYFRGVKRLLTWDDLDFIYFAGYATWNYLVTPFLFLQEGFRFEVLKKALIPGGISIKAIFPDSIPSHCREQIFHFDENRLLSRLDYTAEVVGRWARAAHLCREYKLFSGLNIATRRRVYPRLFGSKHLHYPLLVDIDIENVRPIV